MRKKITYYLVSIVTFGATVVFGITVVHSLWYAPEAEVAVPLQALPAVVKEVQRDSPVRLRVPTLAIDAPIVEVGVTKAGRMATPSKFSQVAWYKYGPTPGQIGSAVLAGHVDNGLALDGVFKHLADIHIGDEVSIVTQKGQTLLFKVQNMESYPYKEVPTNLIFTQADQPRLNLITCEGGWVAKEKTYDHRLVIFTTLSTTTSL